MHSSLHLELVYFVTALVPSDTACLASSPGSSSLTAVCTSLLVIVERLLYCARRDASVAILSNRSFTKEFMMLMALLDIPVSGWTFWKRTRISVSSFFKAGELSSQNSARFSTHLFQNFIDVHGVSLFSLYLSFTFFVTWRPSLLFGDVISHFCSNCTNWQVLLLLFQTFKE